ncbi:MAG: hypothetical protein E7041_02855 [Lentisphaerae bacterium]|nr:hypothetical protein [Lentisphaerota bacterium]
MRKSFWLPVIFGGVCCFGAVTVPTIAPVRPGGVVISGQSEVMPHSGYSALVATEKENYVPLCVDLSGQADGVAGIFKLEYYPFFSKTDEVLLWQSGEMALKLTAKSVTLQISGKNFTAPAEFQDRVWYELLTAWENGRLTVKLDGKVIITAAMTKFPVAGSVTLGGMPDGLLRNIVFDRPAPSPVIQLTGTPREFSIRANNDKFFSFDYFAHGEAVKLQLRPRLAITPGEKFFLIQSGGDPMVLTAEKAGELTVELPASYSNRVELRRDPGNLLDSVSLDKFPAGWQITNAPGLREETVPSFIAFNQVEKPQFPVHGTDRAIAVALDGGNAVKLQRVRKVGYLSIATELKLKPATQYLLGVEHKVLSAENYGGAFLLMVTVTENGKVKQIFKEYHPFTPLRRTGKWMFAPLMFRTAAGKGDLTAKIEVISDGSPCEIALKDVFLREYPNNVYQPMPRDCDRKKVLTGQALIDHLAKRPVATLPTGPLSAVNGRDGNVYKMMGRAGADILFVKVNTDHRQRYASWNANGTYDFSYLDELILNALSYAPDGNIGLCVGIDAPLDFGTVFPDAAWRDLNGNICYMNPPDARFYPERRGQKYPYVSYTAPDFKRECGKFMYAFGEYLSKKPWGRAVVAVHIVGGGDGQWFYRPRKNDLATMMDRSPGNLAAMREAVRKYYKNDLAALRKAWGEPMVTFETISFPAKALYAKYRFQLDPAVPEARKVIDFTKLYPEVVNASIAFATTEFERGLGRKILKSRYYFGTSMGDLLANSPFDMLVSVPPYGVSRRHGAAGRIHQAPGSAALYGKHFLNELDLRTSYSPVAVYGHYSLRQNGVEHGPEGFANMMRKMAAPALIANQGYWYLMIGGNPSMQWEMEAVVKESFEALKYGKRPAVKLAADAAFFWDEEARTMMGERFGWAMDQHGTHQAQKILMASGVGFQMYLLKDLTHPARKPAKLNIFALGTTMTEEQISFVEKNLQKDGNVLVFVFDAGRTAPGGFEKNIRRLTGMNVLDSRQMGLSCFSAARFSDPLSKYIANAAPLTGGPFAQPLYYVDDPGAKPLALHARTDLVGAAVKRHKNWTAVYVGIPLGLAVKPEFIRTLAQEAGITPVAPVNEFANSGNGFIVIHAVCDGKKQLQWDEAADVLDLTTGKIIARKVKTLTVEMKFGETRWFRMLKPAK